jgi:hypothetical protein
MTKKTVSDIRASALKKALPRSKEENEKAIADHLVLRDKVLEGKVLPHNTKQMAEKASSLYADDHLKPSNSTAWLRTAVAQDDNRRRRFAEGFDEMDDAPQDPNGINNEDDLWLDTANAAGLKGSPMVRYTVGAGANLKALRARASQHKKQEAAKNIFPHPNAYEWHEGHTDHHQATEPKDPSGVDWNVDTAKEKARQLKLIKAGDMIPSKPVAVSHPHLDQPPKPVPANETPRNEQAAGVGVATYAKFAAPYGHLAPGTKTDLLHYPYSGKLPEIQKLVTDHGYRTYFAGGQYGKPDLANKNYNTGHLMVYDPTPASGGDFGDHEYTNGWRQIHELAHALTYRDLNKIYGEGRRIGKLGVHRSLNEAMRAVHWEHLAAHKQRELSKQIGIHIPEDVFNKEYNTVMHDAVHRAVTGQFTEPSAEGYIPSAHKVPLSTAMDMLRDEAQKLGLKSAHQTLKKHDVIFTTETGSIDVADYTPNEAVQMLKKAVADKISAFEVELADLRKRELAKAIVPPHKHSQALTVSAGTEDVAPGRLNPKGIDKAEVGEGVQVRPETDRRNMNEDTIDKSDMCGDCGEPSHMDKACMDKAELVDGKGKRKTTSEHPESVLPDDKDPKKVNKPTAGDPGVGGVISKGKLTKSLADIHKNALEKGGGNGREPKTKPPAPMDDKKRTNFDRKPRNGSRPQLDPDDRVENSWANSVVPGFQKSAVPPMAKPPSLARTWRPLSRPRSLLLWPSPQLPLEPQQ